MYPIKKLYDPGAIAVPSGGATPPGEQPPCRSEQELIERYGGIALDKQSDFSAVIGSSNWKVDVSKGEISFGGELVFPFQILGTFSYATSSWLWGWANTESGLPGQLLQQALQLKKYGEEHGIDLLRHSEFGAEKRDLHRIGMIASGMFDASGYYIADYGKGAMVATVKSDKVDGARKENHHRILSSFPQLIAQFDINHRAALKNYLLAKGYEISEEGSKLWGKRYGNTIVAEFNAYARLKKLSG